MRNTTLCYIEKDGSYLMLHRIKKENDVNRDKWVGVGGGFEDGESPEECVIRETFEETGLNLTEFDYRGIVTFVSDKWETEYMHLFIGKAFEGDITDCNEGVLEWVEIPKVRQLALWEGDKIFLDLLEQDVPFFSLKLVYKGEELTNAILNNKKLI